MIMPNINLINQANGPWEYVFPNITHQKQLKYKIMASTRKFTLCLYDIRGVNSSKIKNVTDILGTYDILLLQEHWLNDNKLDTFNVCFVHVIVYIVCIG